MSPALPTPNFLTENGENCQNMIKKWSKLPKMAQNSPKSPTMVPKWPKNGQNVFFFRKCTSHLSKTYLDTKFKLI